MNWSWLGGLGTSSELPLLQSVEHADEPLGGHFK